MSGWGNESTSINGGGKCFLISQYLLCNWSSPVSHCTTNHYNQSGILKTNNRSSASFPLQYVYLLVEVERIKLFRMSTSTASPSFVGWATQSKHLISRCIVSLMNISLRDVWVGVQRHLWRWENLCLAFCEAPLVPTHYVTLCVHSDWLTVFQASGANRDVCESQSVCEEAQWLGLQS